MDKWDDYYQNLTLKGGKLKTDLIIYQDYGDFEGIKPEGYIEIPRNLIVPGSFGSIGWYDNHLCWMDVQWGVFIVIKLFKLNKKEFLRGKKLSVKRPYTFKVIVDKTYEFSNIVKCCLGFRTEPWKIYDFNVKITLKTLLDPRNLEHKFYSGNFARECVSLYVHKMQEILLTNGFNPKISSEVRGYIWSKENSKLKIIEEVKSPHEINYIMDNGIEKQYLYDIDDIKSILNKEYTN